MLWGFPGETLEDYQEQADLMRNLMHLQPPGGGGRIWMERFSPIFSDRETFPAVRAAPERSYSYVYPAGVNLQDVAYYFEYELENTLPDDAYHETMKVVKLWSDTWKESAIPVLRLWRSPGFIQIDDTRDPDKPNTYTFRDALAELYVACFDHPCSAPEASTRANLSYSPKAVEAALDEFVARGLMMRDGNLFLALAVPAPGAFADLSISPSR